MGPGLLTTATAIGDERNYLGMMIKCRIASDASNYHS